jgi:D-amino-acid dehydrogenase
VIGLSCAYYLVRGGADVTVLERDRIGAGASSGNAGTASPGHPPLNRPGRVSQAIRQMLDPASPLYVHPSWNPGLWRWLLGFARYCTPEHVARAMAVMAPLGKDALALFETLIAEERIECHYRLHGYYDVCATEDGLAEAVVEAELARPYGYHPETLDGGGLRRREPALGPKALGGVYYPEAATMDPALFLERLAQVVEKRGARVREGVGVAAVRVDRGPRDRGEAPAGRVIGVELTGGGLEPADAVVIATGPFCLELARKLGTKLPVQPGKGYHRDVPIGPNGAPPQRVACVLHESAVFCTPLDTVVRYAGTMEFSGTNLVMRPARLRQLTVAARELFPKLGPARPVSEWCGLRPMSVDGVPIIGPLPGVDGVSIATGHGMLGLTLAPVTGEMIANHVLARAEPRLDGVSPGRF